VHTVEIATPACHTRIKKSLRKDASGDRWVGLECESDMVGAVGYWRRRSAPDRRFTIHHMR